MNSWLEMDTVIGKTGGKVLLTFNISFCNFIFARLMENKTAAEVVRQIQVLKRDLHLANMEFSKIFPVILTDNGGEFTYADEIEKDYSTQLHLFFCDPQKPSQKGKIEKNHTLVRDIIPKGESFDDLTQEDINLVMSHVNSVRRFGLGNKTAYEIFTFTFTPELASVLGIVHIPDDKVRQLPTLLKK
ncbi:IS30 family transposase [Streptococcus sp. 19428wA2_WM07]|nr:IS30 family transposase [Streptococcus sp. 19428wA2_WM07]TFU27178.1 IS30 family transposase [Streptococcus sp. WM07]